MHTPDNAGNRTIFFNDVTLRDGEQAPGNTMQPEEKVRIAKQLVRAGIPGIEAGFAAASPGDFASVEQIAAEVGSMEIVHPQQGKVQPRISSLARLTQEDIAQAIAAVQSAPNAGMHTFISTSAPQLVKFASALRKRGGNPESMRDYLDRIVLPSLEELLPAAKRSRPDLTVQFSPEDWTRTEESVSDEVILAAAQHGATVINLPDTVGIGIPRIVGKRVAHVRALLDRHGFAHVRISWHGHNDTGQGVANAVEAMYGGAEQMESTIIGIGERTGNFSFESMVAAMDANRSTHEEIMGVRLSDTLVRKEMMRTALLVSETIGQPIPREHPIVGENAFAHESGIHQQGVVAGREGGQMVYEVLRPEEYGTTSKMILGKHSGWSGLKDFLDARNLPYALADRDAFRDALSEAGDTRRKGLSDQEVLEQVYYKVALERTGGPILTNVQEANTGMPVKAVMIEQRSGNNTLSTASAPDQGCVDAMMQALRTIVPTVEIQDFTIHKNPAEEGASATAIASVTLKNGHTVRARAESHNTEHAGVLAVQKAFNHLYAVECYQRQIEAAQ